MVLARFKCDPDTLSEAVRKFRGKRILVIGDLMLDRFVWGSVSRISPEAPVPVVEVRKETTCLGGAANVAANIRALGGIPIPVGIIGDDFEGRRLRHEFRILGSPVAGLVADRSRATSVKTRIIAHHQQVCRTDREDRTPTSPALHRRVVSRFRKMLQSCAAVVVSDYAKGLISPLLLKEILPMARASGKIVCVDPKLKDLGLYRPATVITPNTLEAERASGVTISNRRDLLRAGRKILRSLRVDYLLITRGEEGMALFQGASGVTHIPTVAREVFDVTGAGDTVISTLTLGLVAGLPILQAAVLANIAAGIVVGKLGTATVTPDELTDRLRLH
jgi:D-beta-D-heptose 7-phosphate kinase/D-beta-D-heptose 1-phosphate adenosyltransferase